MARPAYRAHSLIKGPDNHLRAVCILITEKRRCMLRYQNERGRPDGKILSEHFVKRLAYIQGREQALSKKLQLSSYFIQTMGHYKGK